MRFGLLGSAQAQGNDRAAGLGQGFDDWVEFAVEAEALGYHRSFLVEHHFSGWQQVSATLTLLTWLAARTRTLRIGTAVTVLPWHNPVLLAEQVATLDLLSGGRVDFGIGKGYRHAEFSGFCIPIEQAQERFDEALRVILAAWTTEGRFSHHGTYWKFENIVVEPMPAQRPHPPVWMAAGSEASIRNVAARGFNLLLDQFATADVLRDRIAIYKAALADHGQPYRQAGVCVGRDLYVAKDAGDRDDALDRLRARHQRTITAARAPGQTGGSHILSYARAGAPDREAALIGTPDEIYRKIDELRRIGIDDIAFTVLGGSRDTLRRFARDIMPAFEAGAARAAG